MEYLLKASAVVAIFYLCYKLFLQRDTFFEYNRGFLLLGLITAFSIPFIVIPIYIEYTPTPIQNFELSGDFNAAQNTEKPFNILEYIPIIYFIGIIIFTLRFLFQITSLCLIIIKNKSERQGEFKFIKTTNNISPFSFFNWIVYNPKLFKQAELKQIITHEKVHARQYHSIDILLTQLACIVLWFNPFIWLYNKGLKQNLEFIADQNAQRKSECKKSYQHTLLKTSMPTHQLTLSNNFYNSLIKKRIVMLQKSKSKKRNLFKYALVLPFLALFLMSFNAEEIYVEIETTTEKTKTLEAVNISPVETLKVKSDEEVAKKASKEAVSLTKRKSTTQNLKNFKAIITKDFTDSDFTKIINEAKKEGVTLKFRNIKRNSKNEIIAIDAEFKNKKGSGNFNVNGKEPIKSFAFQQNDDGFGFGTVWETKYIGQPISNIQVIGYGDVKFTEGNKLISSDSIIFGGSKNMKYGIAINNDSIHKTPWKVTIGVNAVDSSNNIKNVTPWKGIIGHPASSVNSLDTLKTNNKWKISSARNNNLFVTGDTIYSKNNMNFSTSLNHPLYIVNGLEITEDKFKKIDENRIYSVSVLKDKNATHTYGDKGKNGVIFVTMKNENTPKYKTIKLDSPALYIVDGKKVNKKKFGDLDPESIESVNVLKGNSAIEKYGKKGKDGVIEITTKKKN